MAIVLNTNSYVTEAEADAYMVTRIDAAIGLPQQRLTKKRL